MDAPQLQSQAYALGLSADRLQGLIGRFGPDFLQVAQSLIRQGFTGAWVAQTVEILGRDVLVLVQDYLAARASAGEVPPGAQAQTVPPLSFTQFVIAHAQAPK